MAWFSHMQCGSACLRCVHSAVLTSNAAHLRRCYLSMIWRVPSADAVNIPVSGINIGPVHKRDVLRANVMNERGHKKFACILCFDVAVTKEAREMAQEFNVRIFTADIIYHLFDQVWCRFDAAASKTSVHAASYCGRGHNP